ncbi:MAG: hypothetical protein KatS3mg110_3802 [Pirellulaceae bacterium]|nr:MAG: hypothetical protein KatS3mg110_3802 [Pirellulaceae bacterium]
MAVAEQLREIGLGVASRQEFAGEDGAGVITVGVGEFLIEFPGAAPADLLPDHTGLVRPEPWGYIGDDQTALVRVAARRVG